LSKFNSNVIALLFGNF